MKRTIAAIALLSAGCGAPATGEGRVLAQVETDAGPGAGPDLKDIIQGDERRAVDVLNEAMTAGKGDRAAWAAVYARRLGIKHDVAVSGAVLGRCVAARDPLLAALCWRWLAADPSIIAPPWPDAGACDPIVDVMASLAAARRGKAPPGLGSSLKLPWYGPDAGAAKNDGKDRVESLLVLASPFDNGPLALALAFLEARREEWVETGADGKPAWTAARLRGELARAVTGDDDGLRKIAAAARPARYVGTSAVLDAIDAPLSHGSSEALHGPAMRGTPSLRVAALRALAATARKPTAKDLGAAAA
ncbi:MAG: hypothetical protein PHU25_13770, partial [Deltaproteobacteria bacterium]|nr:hypothetical protein [Deltaproteobacteria bacterium]